MQIKNAPNTENPSVYYQQMKSLALQKRQEFNVVSNNINLNTIRKIYSKEQIYIDYIEVKSKKIRAAYFCDEIDCSVLINSNLPREPKLFSLVHELKHHYVDRKMIATGQFACGDYNRNKTVEIGAEVFSAEFIFPEAEMKKTLIEFGIKKDNCTPTKIVQFRYNCKIPISYTFILKRLNFFGIINKDAYKDVKFKNLQDRLFPPYYKRKY